MVKICPLKRWMFHFVGCLVNRWLTLITRSRLALAFNPLEPGWHADLPNRVSGFTSFERAPGEAASEHSGQPWPSGERRKEATS